MTEDQKDLLAVFEVRTHDLISLSEAQKFKIQELTQTIDSRESDIQQAKVEISEWKAKYLDLLTAQVASFSNEDLKSARMRISKLVREVDKCIALLNGEV